MKAPAEPEKVWSSIEYFGKCEAEAIAQATASGLGHPSETYVRERRLGVPLRRKAQSPRRHHIPRHRCPDAPRHASASAPLGLTSCSSTATAAARRMKPRHPLRSRGPCPRVRLSFPRPPQTHPPFPKSTPCFVRLSFLTAHRPHRGIGIAAENLTRLFERFERAVSERNYGGLGHGLYICRTIVEALGGTIGVESEVGKGATFQVRLPLQTPPGR